MSILHVSSVGMFSLVSISDGPVQPLRESRNIYIYQHANNRRLVSSHTTSRKAATAESESETQPKIPSCALIIARPTTWNSGM